MTHEEKKQIGKMRAAGMSYTRIAEALDISINSVKSYCQRHGLGADSAPETHSDLVTACPPQSEAGACEQCGSPVLQAGMRLDGHDRAVTLASAGEENHMPGSFQVSPYSGRLTPKLGHADILGYDLKIQLSGLM